MRPRRREVRWLGSARDEPGHETSSRAAQPGHTPLIFVVFGAGGVGKGTVVSRLLHLLDGLWLSRSWTTRSRRPSEEDDAYNFAAGTSSWPGWPPAGLSSGHEFAGNGHLYGTPTMEAPEGSDVVLEIDAQGAIQVKERYPDAVLIFIAAPSREAQELRLRQRGDDEASIERRLRHRRRRGETRSRAGGLRGRERRPRTGFEGAGRYSGYLRADGGGRDGGGETTRQEHGLNG